MLTFAALWPCNAHAQDDAQAPVCVEPVTDADGQPDPDLERGLRAAVPLLVTPSGRWHFAATRDTCEAQARVRFYGHRAPEVRYVVEVQLPGQATQTLSVDSHATMGTFAIAEALCVNAMLLLGQPLRPSVSPLPDHTMRLWLAPTMTLGTNVAVFGSEVGFGWKPWAQLWVAASVGFETFGRGSTSLGRYQYSVIQGALLVGWRWQLARLGVAAGVGLQQRTWISHLQTTTLHDDFDIDLALASELRLSMRVSRALRLGLALRPSVGLSDVSVGAPDEQALLHVPRALLQSALEIAIDL